jgi:hypothetical protein
MASLTTGSISAPEKLLFFFSEFFHTNLIGFIAF